MTEFCSGNKQVFKEYSTQWIAQNNLVTEYHVLPTDDDPPSQQKLRLLRWRAWDKSPIALNRLTTCNRVKTTNPEYKNTQQDLTWWNLSFRLSRVCKLSKRCRVLTAGFYPTLPRRVGFCQSDKQLQLTII